MNPFLERFKSKSKDELRFILENPNSYTFEAIEAAELLLQKIKDPDFDIVKEELIIEEKVKPKKRSSEKSVSLVLKSFGLKTLGSYIVLSIFYWSVFEFLQFYSEENFIERYFLSITILLLVIVTIVNHWFFNSENHERPSFLDRTLNSIFFWIILLGYRVLFDFVVNDTVDE